MTIRFALIVIRTPEIEIVAHGDGPEHFAGKVGEAVLEIYPLKEGSSIEAGSRIGFTVAKLDEVMKTLHSKGVNIVGNAKQTDWGYGAVVRDPDGREVELTEGA